jgi:hypothetical protein
MFDNAWANQTPDKLQRTPSPMPAPNMKQAGQMPQQQPSPFPQSGFAKQGLGGGQKPALPNLMDEQ